jgi:hypothetical protein
MVIKNVDVKNAVVDQFANMDVLEVHVRNAVVDQFVNMDV